MIAKIKQIIQYAHRQGIDFIEPGPLWQRVKPFSGILADKELPEMVVGKLDQRLKCPMQVRQACVLPHLDRPEPEHLVIVISEPQSQGVDFHVHQAVCELC